MEWEDTSPAEQTGGDWGRRAVASTQCDTLTAAPGRCSAAGQQLVTTNDPPATPEHPSPALRAVFSQHGAPLPRGPIASHRADGR